MTRWAPLAFAACLLGCGAAPTPEPATAANVVSLGVQSNVPEQVPIELRVRATRPLQFATRSQIRMELDLMGTPMRLDSESRGVRRATPLPGDQIELEDRETSRRTQVVGLGGEEHADGAPQPQSGEPTRRVIDRLGADVARPGAAAPGAPRPDAAEGQLRARLEAALAPLMGALAYPDQPLRVGQAWGAESTIALSDVEAGMHGTVRYALAQRLVRLEGSGERRVAVIALEGWLEGAGAPEGETQMLHGRIDVRGTYTVALSDGFARAARVDVSGRLVGDESEAFELPIDGRIEWDAEPIE